VSPHGDEYAKAVSRPSTEYRDASSAAPQRRQPGRGGREPPWGQNEAMTIAAHASYLSMLIVVLAR